MKSKPISKPFKPASPKFREFAKSTLIDLMSTEMINDLQPEQKKIIFKVLDVNNKHQGKANIIRQLISEYEVKNSNLTTQKSRRPSYELMHNHRGEVVIKVIGVGGGGGNAIENMLINTIEGVEFVVVNTDSQALSNSSAENSLQIGPKITKGLGAGANPEIGHLCAVENQEDIRSILDGSDMVFIVAGMGGGTGTGASPVIARIAKEMGILTIAVLTKPFPFEGKRRVTLAEQGIGELSMYVDSIITIPNGKLLKVLGKGTSLLDAFKAANNILLGAVKGISELVTMPGLINVDFADVRAVTSGMGKSMVGTGIASGSYRAEEAAEAAISSPFLEDTDLSEVKGVLVNITSGLDISIEESTMVVNTIKAFVSENSIVVVNAMIDMDMTEELMVTIIATGINDCEKPDISLTLKRHQSSTPMLTATGASILAGNTAIDTIAKVAYKTSPQISSKKLEEADKENRPDIPKFLRKLVD